MMVFGSLEYTRQRIAFKDFHKSFMKLMIRINGLAIVYIIIENDLVSMQWQVTSDDNFSIVIPRPDVYMPI